MKKVVWKILISLLILVSAFTDNVFADDWILAAQKFNLPQQDVNSSSLEGVSSLIPQLILEQIVTGGERVPSSREMLNRKTDQLLLERNTLFTQLSSEIKKRDAVYFNVSNVSERQKNYETINESINEIQNRIKENIEKTEALKNLYKDAIEKEESSEDGYYIENNDADKKNFNLFSVFGKKSEKEEIEIPAAEKIALYKNDSSSLFVPTENAVEAGVNSPEYAKEINGQKIKGILNGSILMYGDYIAVTAEVFVFPGAVSIGKITDVGTVADCVQIAETISSFFSPKIYTSMPVDVYFELDPPEAKAEAKLAVDGFVYSSVPDKLKIRSGVHTIEVESKKYNKQTVVWNFKDSRSFLVHVSLTEKNNGELNLSMLMPYAGSYLVNGIFSEEEEPLSFSTKITVNGQPALGYFRTEEPSVKKVLKEITDDKGVTKKRTVFEESGKIGAFFYIPEALMVPESSLVVDLKPVDNVLEIDKRRIMMYRGYSILLCSLPFTFIAKGKAEGFENAMQDPGMWKTAKYISTVVSLAAGGFFVYELIRYLKAAENVIPETSRTMKPGEKEKLDALYAEFIEKSKESEAEVKVSQQEEQQEEMLLDEILNE